jgi:hypothetical protein
MRPYQWRLRLDARHRCFVKSSRGASAPVDAVVFDSGDLRTLRRGSLTVSLDLFESYLQRA